MCFTSNLTFVFANCRYLTYCAAAEVLEKLDKDEDWKVNFSPPSPLPPFHLPYSYTEQFIATLRSSISTEIKVSVSFSFNAPLPFFSSISL